MAQLGIKGYDWDNALGQSPKLQERRRDWQPGKPGQTSEQVRDILRQGWEYYFTNIIGVDFVAPPEAWFQQVLALNAPRGQGWSFLTDGGYFRIGLGSDYEEWIVNDNTAVSFAAFRCFPGEIVLDAAGIKPWMFTQTGRGQATIDEVVDRFRYLYERFWHDPARGMSAGEQYRLHYQTAAFLPEKWLRDHGLPKRRWDGLGTTRKAIKEQIAHAYGDYESERAWNAGRFRADHPELEFDRCFICRKSSGVELHHLHPVRGSHGIFGSQRTWSRFALSFTGPYRKTGFLQPTKRPLGNG